jgi:pyruvyl transferase EpsO
LENADTVKRLSDRIRSVITPYVTSDYWLLEVPYYNNVGDTLIWQGELDFLKVIPHKCKGAFSFWSKKAPALSAGDLVLFQGGGNFGDLWKEPHEYRERIMEQNPKCRYLVFPQTIYYRDKENLAKDAEFFGRYDCTICARDNVSYRLLKDNFKNNAILAPDMAFCMDIDRWRECKSNIAPKPIILKRDDMEFRSTCQLEKIMSSLDADVADWLPLTTRSLEDQVKSIILRNPRTLGWLFDWYMQGFYRRYLIRSGVRQLESHGDVFTTRLHACILSILLGKKHIVLFDNAYGKNRSFYDTWLADCGNVEIMN